MVGHMAGHAVVDAAAGQNHLGVVAHFLRFVGEVVRVHANTVAAHQAGAKGQKVPLGAGGLQHFEGVDAELVKDQAQLVHQCNVHVALGVFNDLGGFGHANAAGLVGASGDDLGIELVNGLGRLRGAAAGHFFNAGQTVLFVTGVDALGAVAAKKVVVELEATQAFEHGHAHFFGGTGVHGGFVNDHVADFEGLAHGFAGFDERRQIGAVGLVHGCGHGDDEHLARL